jgi:hypothetical protein
MAPAAAFVFSALGTAVSAYGAIQQGRAAKAEAEMQARQQEAQAQVYENNAIRAGQQSIMEAQQAGREITHIKAQLNRALGRQRAAASASGLTLTGSVYDVGVDTAITAETDIHMATYRGRIGAMNAQTQAQDFLSQGVLSRYQANVTRAAGANRARSAKWTAAGMLLSGGASMASTFTFNKGTVGFRG